MRAIAIALFLLFGFSAFGQIESVGISYYGLVYIQPGVKARLTYNNKSWNKTAKDSLKQKKRSWFFQPQLAAYWKQNNYNGIILNLESGILMQSANQRWYSAYSVGLAYMAHFEVTSLRVNFKGEIENKDYEWRHFALPSLNAEYGFNFNKKIAAFAKVSAAYRLSVKFGSTLTPSAELGLRYRLTSKLTPIE